MDENVVVWHDTPLRYNKVVKNGQIVNIKLKWKPYNNSNFQNEELNSLRKQINDLTIENKKLKAFNESLLNSNS